MSYTEQLQSREWKELRTRIIQAKGLTCEDCGLRGGLADFNLHHKYYESQRMAWEYPDDCFKVLCWECHEGTTEALKTLLFNFGYFNSGQIIQISNAIQESIIINRDTPERITSIISLCLSDISNVEFPIKEVAL